MRRRHAVGAVATVTAAVVAMTAAVTGSSETGDMPNRVLTPGVADVRVSQATVTTTICVPGYTTTVRSVPASERRAVFAAYGIPYAKHARYELDHLISLELGGSNAAGNLWPEPYAGKHGARAKDVIETRLKRLVCSGTVTLAQAQTAIAEDWEAAARTYATP